MKKNNIMKWADIYNIWKLESSKYSELCNQTFFRSVNFLEPKYGPCYYFNWVKIGDEEDAIQKDLAVLASWQDIGEEWSKGTIKTAGLLASCETEEEHAAVWIAAFALSLVRWKTTINTTVRNAYMLEHEARSVFTHKFGYWHTNSRDFFPECYIPDDLFWDSEELSISTLVKLAVINAAMVVTHYIPIEYKRVQKRV